MRRFCYYFSILTILGFTVACYWYGLQGDFLFDDVINIQNNASIRISQLDISSLWQAAMSSSAGMLNRPISMASFALNHYFTGNSAFHFKATNLAIHLLNGIAVFLLSRLLLDLYRRLHRPELSLNAVTWLSIAVAGIWLLHPFNLTGVLYVVQRMASLSSFFVFCGLILYLLSRKRLILQRPGAWNLLLLSIVVFIPLSLFSKENGVLLPVFMLIAEMTILQWNAPDQRSRMVLKGIFSFLVGLPAIFAVGYLLFNPGFITSGYLIRDFTLVERLMTESRVLWFYLHMTLLPDLASMGFHHDDFAISRGLTTPPTTLFAIAGLLLLFGIALVLRKKQPLLAFGVSFFLIGHSLESSIISLELVHEHRNYLPMIGILLPAVYYAATPVYHSSSLVLRQTAVMAVLILFGGLTFLRAGQWGNPLTMLQMEVQHHPESARAHADLAIEYVKATAGSSLEAQENYRKAMRHFISAANLSETDTSGFFGIIALKSRRGESVDPSWSEELKKRLERLPSSPSSINSLVALEKCQVSGRCKLSPELMEELMRASLRNPTLSGPRRSAALFALSDFMYKSRKQPEQAVAIAYQAINAAPEDLDQQLTLIVFLINMRKLEEANVVIANTYEMDAQGRHTEALAQLEKQLVEARRMPVTQNAN